MDYKANAIVKLTETTLQENANRALLQGFYMSKAEEFVGEPEKAAQFRVKADQIEDSIKFDTDFMTFINKPETVKETTPSVVEITSETINVAPTE